MKKIILLIFLFCNPSLADDNDYKNLNLNSLADTIDCIKDKEGSMNWLRAKNYCVTKKSKTWISANIPFELDRKISGSMWSDKDSNKTITRVDVRIKKKLPNILIHNIKFKINFKNGQTIEEELNNLFIAKDYGFEGDGSSKYDLYDGGLDVESYNANYGEWDGWSITSYDIMKIVSYKKSFSSSNKTTIKDVNKCIKKNSLSIDLTDKDTIRKACIDLLGVKTNLDLSKKIKLLPKFEGEKVSVILENKNKNNFIITGGVIEFTKFEECNFPFKKPSVFVSFYEDFTNHTPSLYIFPGEKFVSPLVRYKWDNLETQRKNGEASYLRYCKKYTINLLNPKIIYID